MLKPLYTYKVSNTEMTVRDKLRQKKLARDLEERYRLENSYSHKYEGTNYNIDYGKDD